MAGGLRERLRGRLHRNRDRTLTPAGTDLDGVQVVRFFRRFKRFHGGHLKVWDYFNHVSAAPGHAPVVTFAPDSVFDTTNPWDLATLQEIDAPDARVLFLAGRDWSRVPDDLLRDPGVIVLNLIQHMRHTDPNVDLYRHLGRRAIRICVGPELGAAVEATGAANGPVVVIPDGLDIGAVQQHTRKHRTDLVVVAGKQPELGRRLRDRLAEPGRTVDLLDAQVDRGRFLDALGAARVALFVPNPTEGFYLPALEAMALGTLVVCPDCVGNRSFCRPGETAFRPAFTEDALVAAAQDALHLDDDAYATMTANAMTTAARHDLPNERARFIDLLGNLEELWRS